MAHHFLLQVHVTLLPSHPRAIVFIPTPLLQLLVSRDVTGLTGSSVLNGCVCVRERERAATGSTKHTHTLTLSLQTHTHTRTHSYTDTRTHRGDGLVRSHTNTQPVSCVWIERGN